MDWSVLFIGPVGAGKTQAIRTISDIEVVDTDVAATDETRALKPLTTVSMDVGVMRLEGGGKIRLYGAPGQDRFDFMWDILLLQSQGIVLLVDDSREAPVRDLATYVDAIEKRLGRRKVPLVVGVTHLDGKPASTLKKYDDFLMTRHSPAFEGIPPVFEIDARNPAHVRAGLIAVAAMQEMGKRVHA